MLTFCTIVSRNYLANARALARSVRKNYPGSSIFVLLVDDADGADLSDVDLFTLIPVRSLNIPCFQSMSFQYNILELNTAVKPFFLDALLRKPGVERLVYLDPDILVFHPLDHVEKLLDNHNIVLTPHITQPYEDDCRPTELDILQAGSFNLGFIALSASSESSRFLAWWQKQLKTGCRIAPDLGMLVDQKWIDLIPCTFDRVSILKHPGYNVAYWNLHERRITRRFGQFLVQGEPCRFFHFSGYDPDAPDCVSKYQDRWQYKNLGQAKQLFQLYRHALKAEGHEAGKNAPYAFDQFENGTPITGFVRRLYLNLGSKVHAFGDPFRVGPGTFHDWLLDFREANLPPVLEAIHEARPELGGAMPEPTGRDQVRFLNWILDEPGVEQLLGAPLARAARARVRAFLRSTRSLPARLPHRPRPFGVNAIGLKGTQSLALRSALRAAGIPVHFGNEVSRPYAIDLVHSREPNHPRDRRAILMLHTDLTAIPHDRVAYLNTFDEVWTPSTFLAEALSDQVSVGLRWLPLPVAELGPKRPRRAGPFRILVNAGTADDLQRTNAGAAIKAFQHAFRHRKDVHLIVCGKGLNPSIVARGRALAGTHANIRFTLMPFTRLIEHCDALLSLHRSVGDPAEIALAMARGLPVIATAYGGNMDLMTDENSLLIRFTRVSSAARIPGIGRVAWAEPDHDHAVRQLRRLVDDPARRQSIAEMARRTIADQLAPKVIGTWMRRRFEELLQHQPPTECRFDTADRARLADLADPLVLGEANTRGLPGRFVHPLRRFLARLLRPFAARQAEANSLTLTALDTLEQRLRRQQACIHRQEQELCRLHAALLQSRYEAKSAGPNAPPHTRCA